MSPSLPFRGVRLKGITKRFPAGTLANDEVSCEVPAGRIRAILGENGAGKTTLMRILAGFYKPDTGVIEIDGIQKSFRTPTAAKAAGIGMVHQHFSLVAALTVAENIALGLVRTPFLLRPGRWTASLTEKAAELGFDIRPQRRVSELSVGEKQRVEIFRLVLEGARVLVLDEPTSILAPQEAEVLFQHIHRLASLGCSIFLVTHKIRHVERIATDVTVLRRGRVVVEGETGAFSASDLAVAMAGGPSVEPPAESHFKSANGSRDLILQVRNLHVKPTVSRCGVADVSLDVHSGEVVGLAGISGNGQDELLASLVGGLAYSGSIHFPSGSSEEDPGRALAYLPADARRTALALDLSVRDNLIMRCYRLRAFSSHGILRSERLAAFAKDCIARFDIRPAQLNESVWKLSGGNAQKVMVARELAGNPQLIVAASPTAGLDLATAGLVRAELVRHAAADAAVLVIAEDIDELLAICNRIVVIYTGRIVGDLLARPAARQDISMLMSGGRVEQNPVPPVQAPL